ncbi:hypothetical protein FISHEDRAFT_67438 [Fistulina hepatica ATCC 64428]|uniref:HECT-type E3 ubiquitin transferase n=1 Tax=Fistulina hepatica ATCC 64428 TaxID=1128425 RepID=A0A0D7A0F4_9AGAR|nr:hypothetical protein FISHEDRAFT_67438 [Fistulina hepatica ATCC 64428]
MYPLFGDETRRKINLGGVSTRSNRADILSDASARRIERERAQRQRIAATRIQSWWRGARAAEVKRAELKRTFEGDVTGITGLRCLLFLHNDDDALCRWAKETYAAGPDVVFAPAQSSQAMGWFFLIRRSCLRVLQALSSHPQTQAAVHYAQALLMFLSPKAPTALPLAEYLTAREYYSLLAQAIYQLVLAQKNSSPLMPLLAELLVAPHILPLQRSSAFQVACVSYFRSVLTIPLLPNRLPLASLTRLSANFPFPAFLAVASHVQELVSALDVTGISHLLANLTMFVPPRYSAIEPRVLSAYLSLLTALCNSLPVGVFDPPTTTIDPYVDEGESEGEPLRVEVVDDFTLVTPSPEFDDRTLKRLNTLYSRQHMRALLSVTQREMLRIPLARFLVSLMTMWPRHRETVLSAVLASQPAFPRELYRGYVRSSPLGRESSTVVVPDTQHAHTWPPLLLLTDLYRHALQTMGDDEFFGASGRNPLTLDELISFSRQLLNIAFTLYMRNEPGRQTGIVPDSMVFEFRSSCEAAREQVTRCLVAIHARE